MCVEIRACNAAVLGDCGRFPLWIESAKSCVNYRAVFQITSCCTPDLRICIVVCMHVMCFVGCAGGLSHNKLLVLCTSMKHHSLDPDASAGTRTLRRLGTTTFLGIQQKYVCSLHVFTICTTTLRMQRWIQTKNKFPCTWEAYSSENELTDSSGDDYYPAPGTILPIHHSVACVIRRSSFCH